MTTEQTSHAAPIDHDKLFIGGRWTSPSSTSRIGVVNATTEELAGSVPEAREADVDAAVAAARAAFDDPSGWASWEPAARAEAIERLADSLEARADQIAPLVSIENGMPLAVAQMLEAVFPALLLRYYAGLVIENPVEEVRPGVLGGSTIVRREPLGVVAAIVPWNVPQTLAACKYAPALAAGCTVVLKPSPETALDAMVFADAVTEAGLPDGVVNVLPADREVGAYLVEHPGVDKVAFTGSTVAGRQIAETCGRLLRPVTLELGGKSAAIVLDDVELDLAAIGQKFMVATMFNNGQACFASTRILAPRARYDEVVEAVAALAGTASVGDPLEPTTLVGPMASARARDRVEGYIAKGREEGARVVAGGGRPQGLDRGWFVEPTVFADVENHFTIAREEIFGPVLSVIPYDGEDDAVDIANDSEYGLAGSVWTSDQDRGVALARRVRTGTLGINGYLPDPAAPFGGVKASGIGRELGPEGLAGYQNLKTIYQRVVL